MSSITFLNPRRLQLLALISGLYLLCACSTYDYKEPSQIVSDEVSELISNSELTAVSVVFVVGDSVDTYHFGEFSDGSVPSDTTVYDIGSITKTHVGLLLAQAVTDKLVKLDSPVSLYLDEVNSEALVYEDVDITVRHLATHLSGLPTDLSCDGISLSPEQRLKCFLNYSDDILLNDLNEYRLQEKPGSNYRYSNTGIRLIGIILEKAYNTSIQQLLKKKVYTRTGQVETLAKLSAEQHSRWRQGVYKNEIPAPDASSYFNAAGGLKSTTTDMGKYLNFYLNSGDELAEKALTMLAGEHDGLGRAYIWNTFQLDSEGQYYHGGGTFGTSAWVSIYPREKLGIFLVTPYAAATTQAELNETANRIIEMYRKTKDQGH